MELYQLSYFLEVARQGNFTRAARQLRLAQPALSQQMRRLEEELGAPLLIRGRRQTGLTAAGEALRSKAETLLAMAESARQAVAEAAQLRQGRLVIATIPAMSACWLPPLIGSFRLAHPHVELQLLEESSEAVADLIDQGTAELGFLQLPVKELRFHLRKLVREPFRVLLSRQHPLAGRKQLMLKDLSAEGFILYKGKVRSVVQEACRAAGFEPRLACETSQLETVRALVRTGLGVAVLPQLALLPMHPELISVPLHRPRLERHLGMISRKGATLSQAAEAFVKTLAHHASPGLASQE